MTWMRLIGIISSLTFSMAASAQSNLREIELSYLRSAVVTDLLPYATIEVPAIDNLRTGSDGRGTYLALRTYYKQPLKNGGIRAEIAVDFPFLEGDTVRYSWRFFLPSNFVSDSPSNRWWLMAQWHDQPDRDAGQTWDGFPSRSPPVALGYGQIDGHDLISLVYGAPTQISMGTFPISRNVWHDIAVEITWSRGGSGRARVFLDNATASVREARGTNMHNAFQHYMKLGMYRNAEIRGDTWVQLGDISARRVPKP